MSINMNANIEAEPEKDAASSQQAEVKDEPSGEQGADMGVDDTRPQRRKSKRRVPLSVPPGKPARLIEMEEKVIAAVRALFDDVQEMDESIEAVGQAITDLMANRVQRVGVDWQSHRRRGGRHPVVFKTAGSGGVRGGVGISAKKGPGGASEGYAKRYWVEPIDPPTALARYAQVLDWKLPPSEQPRAAVEAREAQRSLLQALQELLAHRESALRPLGRLLQAIEGWKTQNKRRDHPDWPPVDCVVAQERLEEAAPARREQLVIARMNMMSAENTTKLNDQDDDRREDGAPR